MPTEGVSHMHFKTFVVILYLEVTTGRSKERKYSVKPQNIELNGNDHLTRKPQPRYILVQDKQQLNTCKDLKLIAI